VAPAPVPRSLSCQVRDTTKFWMQSFQITPSLTPQQVRHSAHPLFMLSYVHNSTTIWRFWDPHRRRVIQASKVTLEWSGFGLDASPIGLCDPKPVWVHWMVSYSCMFAHGGTLPECSMPKKHLTGTAPHQNGTSPERHLAGGQRAGLR